MLTLKKIKEKIYHIKNTEKVINAMKMIAANKMHKSQNKLFESLPYAEKLFDVISCLSSLTPQIDHPYTQSIKIRKSGFIILTTNKGLCGSLNNILIKKILLKFNEYIDNGIKIKICIIGNRGYKYFSTNSTSYEIIGQNANFEENITIENLIGISKIMLDEFDSGNIQEINLCFNKFINNITYIPTIKKILPINLEKKEEKVNWNYIYEPNKNDLLNKLFKRYVEAQIYASVLENFASEQSSRMIAMMSASDNAKKIVNDLKQTHDKLRQNSITNEISEIINGSKSLNNFI